MGEWKNSHGRFGTIQNTKLFFLEVQALLPLSTFGAFPGHFYTGTIPGPELSFSRSMGPGACVQARSYR